MVNVFLITSVDGLRSWIRRRSLRRSRYGFRRIERHVFWKRKRQFELSGGRAGILTFRHDDQCAELEWERLVGEFDMVVYGNRSWWRVPANQPLTKEEARDLVRRLAAEMKINVELAFSDGTELIRGKGAV